MNPLGNWYFILGIVVFFTPIVWFVTDKIVEPRLGTWNEEVDDQLRADLEKGELSADERRGLRHAGLVALLVAAAFAALCLWPGYTPFIDQDAEGPIRLQPLYALDYRGAVPAFPVHRHRLRTCRGHDQKLVGCDRDDA